MAEGLRVQAASLEVKRLESLSRPPCYNQVVSSLGRSAFLLSMCEIDAINIEARDRFFADAKAELGRSRRELDDAKREINLTIETKVQESLASVRQKARQALMSLPCETLVQLLRR
jgi:hypothetical protein